MIFDKLSALIAEQFNVDVDSITMDTSFEDDLNADSVDIVDLSMALEEEFGKAFYIVPSIELYGKPGKLIRFERCSGKVIGSSVDAVFAIICTFVGEQYLEERNTSAVSAP